MHRVAAENSAVQAAWIVEELRSAGIAAYAGVGESKSDFPIFVSQSDDIAKAWKIHSDWGKTGHLDDDELDALAKPDLSILDASLAPPCPSCGGLLPMDASLAKCPHCSEAVDVAEEIVQRHGPEVMDPCFVSRPQSKGGYTDGNVLWIAHRFFLSCSRCRYSLEGLPLKGKCPECGEPYNKRQMLQIRPEVPPAP